MNYRIPIGGGDLWGQLHPVWITSHPGFAGASSAVDTQIRPAIPYSEQQYGLLNPLNRPVVPFQPIPPT
jgi:hypothetical protein